MLRFLHDEAIHSTKSDVLRGTTVRRLYRTTVHIALLSTSHFWPPWHACRTETNPQRATSQGFLAMHFRGVMVALVASVYAPHELDPDPECLCGLRPSAIHFHPASVCVEVSWELKREICINRYLILPNLYLLFVMFVDYLSLKSNLCDGVIIIDYVELYVITYVS